MALSCALSPTILRCRTKCRRPGILRLPALYLLFCAVPCLAQSLQTAWVDAPVPLQTQKDSVGTIAGTVLDPNGNFVVSATITLSHEGSTAELELKSDQDGYFLFTNVPAGPFQITITAQGFGIRQEVGVLHAAEALVVPNLSLAIAGATTEVQVRVTTYELAEEQIKVQETQRVLGVIPNFYVTYDPAALPLKPKQKFELAWKSNVDPVTFAATGAVAGIQQASDGFSGYGQGTEGYAKRFGANYANGFIGNMIGGAILPSILKQDPRYFYKGNGSKRSRVLYALANAVVCKGDNGHWQPDYSGILGSLAAGGISNLYYPASDRNGVQLTFENTLLGIAGSGIGNLFQEFLVRRLTPHARDPKPNNP
jgi:Carboxypeptidase regulatory-like domain